MKRSIKECGERAKKWREASGMTQKELADKVGCTNVTICNYENGKSMPQAILLDSIAKELGVFKEYLTGEIDYPTVENYSAGISCFNSEQAKAIIELLHSFGYTIKSYGSGQKSLSPLDDLCIVSCPDGKERAFNLTIMSNAAQAFIAIIESGLLPLKCFDFESSANG